MTEVPKNIKEAEDIVAYFNDTNHFFKNRIITQQYLLAVRMINEVNNLQESTCNTKIQEVAKKTLKISTLKVIQDEKKPRKYVLINTANNKQYHLGLTEFESIYLLCIKTKDIIKQLAACLVLLLNLVVLPACSTQPVNTTLKATNSLTHEENLWYPTHELCVTYQQDTFQIIAVDVYKQIGIIRKGKRQIVRPLDSLKLVE
jgi:hypothetical protein